MPNGDPNWMVDEFPKLKAFFGRISCILEQFAAKYNLRIEKYYHQGKNWAFQFRHPKGGLGQIFVIKLDDETIGIASSWSISDYDVLLDYGKHTETERYFIGEVDLLAVLTRHLKRLISWERVELKPQKIHINWKEVSKEKLLAQEQEYPIPKL